MVPAGRVVTYGDLAAMAGLPRAARFAGQVLKNLPVGSDLPWHRVVNASGRISLDGAAAQRQAAKLAQEGVEVIAGRVALKRYRWDPQQTPGP